LGQVFSELRYLFANDRPQAADNQKREKDGEKNGPDFASVKPREASHHGGQDEAQQNRERDGHENLAPEIKAANDGGDNDCSVCGVWPSAEIGARSAKGTFRLQGTGIFEDGHGTWANKRSRFASICRDLNASEFS